MNEGVLFLTEYGYAALFLWVLAEQLGVPLPSLPVLLAAGALAPERRRTTVFQGISYS